MGEMELYLMPVTAKSKAGFLLDRVPVCTVMCKADSTCGWVESSSVDNKGVVYSLNVCRAESQKLCMGRGNK